MGLDFLDVAFRIERAFKIDISLDEFRALIKDNDIAVVDLYEFILTKLHLRDVGRLSLRVNQYLWDEMQHALHVSTEMPLEQIHLGLRLDTLFPRENRRDLWNSLREVCPYRIRELDYPRVVRRACLVMALAVVAIEQLHIWQIPGAKWFWHVLTVVAVWMVYETYAKMLSICAKLRVSFPAGMKTVKDLCRNVMSLNYTDICEGSALVLDEHSVVVWEQLVEILAQAIGVEPAEVTLHSRVFRDLGAA